MSEVERSHPREELIRELKLLRERGLTQLSGIEIPELLRLANSINLDSAVDERAKVESALRRSVENLGGGPYGESAALLFGLVQGMRASSSRIRREHAAAAIDKVADTFRKRYEPTLIQEIADNFIALAANQVARDTWREMEQRHPADSRLAVQWVERFESYYRIWTSVYALGADLTASRSTMLESDRPYDRSPETTGPDDPGYTQEDQAVGYAASALYWYARFQWEVQQFIIRHGGLWLFASIDAEILARDAIYRIGWHVTPFNERDASLLREGIGQSPGHEMHAFLEKLATTTVGSETLEEWCQWVGACQCRWSPGDGGIAYFPTSKLHPGIEE